MNRVNTNQIKSAEFQFTKKIKSMNAEVVLMQYKTKELVKNSRKWNAYNGKRKTKKDEIVIIGIKEGNIAKFKVKYQTYDIQKISPETIRSAEEIEMYLKDIKIKLEDLIIKTNTLSPAAEEIDKNLNIIKGVIAGANLTMNADIISSQPESNKSLIPPIYYTEGTAVTPPRPYLAPEDREKYTIRYTEGTAVTPPHPYVVPKEDTLTRIPKVYYTEGTDATPSHPYLAPEDSEKYTLHYTKGTDATPSLIYVLPKE